jgi:putative oxidoreductase
MDTSASSKASPVLNISLWIVQVLLAVAFGFAGVMKTTAPIADLIEKMIWPGAMPEALVRFIGASELSAALGLTLPSLTRIKPWLTPLAAAGLVVVMALAAIFHVTRGEMGSLPINVGLGSLAVFVAWGRWKKAPIAPRA